MPSVTVLRPQKPPRASYLKCKRTEAIARTYIESLGYLFTVNTTSTGPDIIGFKNGRAYTFEVKPAFKHSRNYWVTGPVLPARRNDHFVAIVMPDNTVVIQPMRQHISKCNERGVRVVTDLVREHCPGLFIEKPKPEAAQLEAKRIGTPRLSGERRKRRAYYEALAYLGINPDGSAA